MTFLFPVARLSLSRSALATLAVPLAILAAALAVRLAAFDAHLWYDEVYGAVFSRLGPLDMLTAILRFDLHPPLYYLQLGLWALPSGEDVWLCLNALAWSLAALAGLYFGALTAIGAGVAATAAALFALMPAAIYQSDQVRMYSFLMTLALAAWYGVERLTWMSPDDQGWRRWAALAGAAELGIVYSHATGMLMIPGFPVYMALRALDAPRGRRGFLIRRAVLVHAAVAAASLPALGNTLVRSVSHTTVPDAAQVWSTLTALVSGPPSPVALPLLLLVLAVVVAGSVLDSRARALALAFVVVPPALLLAVSHGFRPAWHVRALVFAAPLMALTIAVSAAAVAERLRRMAGGRVFAGVFLPALLVMGFAVQAGVHVGRAGKPNDFPGLAAFLESQRHAGDAVLVPDPVVFWGLARSYIGPDWGSPLSIQASDLPDRWAAIRARLGPERWRRLGLEAEADAAGPDSHRLLAGWGALSRATEAPRIWLVQVPPIDGGPLERQGWRRVVEQDFRGLRASLWRPPSGS
jgi:mannosyltransferase